MYGKSPKNKQLKATVWFELLTFELFLWCEFPGYVKDAREKELFVMQIGIFFFNMYADGSQKFWGRNRSRR